MGIRDRFTDAVGGMVAGAVGVATEALAKANGQIRDEPANRSNETTALTTATGRASLPPEEATEDPQGLLFDPFALIDQLGYRDRPSGLTYTTLRSMSKRVPTYMAILQTRVTQVASFGQRQRDPREAGFGIVLRDDKATPTRQDEIRMRQLEDWMLQTGSAWAPGRDDFKTFLRKLTRDAMVLDQGCFEIVHNRKGLPAEFYALDAATCRLADVPPGAQARQDADMVRYVQVYDEIIISEFGAHEMCFGVRNPRSDIKVNGYGYSELEMLISVITASLWAFEYNKKFFAQGTNAKGILNFKGQNISDSKMDGFRRQWQMMISGVSNAHRTPMVNGIDDLQWIPLDPSNRDMEFSAWMDWLIKITCAVAQFDPEEMNFSYGNAGQTSQMFGTPVEGKLKHSKDRGLKPLLQDIANWINQYLIWPLDPYVEFRFLGLDAKDADDVVDLAKKKSEFLMTVDELRAEDDLDPMPDGKGERLLNPVWAQMEAADQQASMMDQQPEEGGGEDPQQMGDVMDVVQKPDDGANEQFDFDSVFESQKSLSGAEQYRASRRQLEADRLLGDGDLRKSRKARVKVYDIEL